MIIDIRGTHGSGKSTVMRTLLDNHKFSQLRGPAYIPDATNPRDWTDKQRKQYREDDHLGYHFPEWDAVLLGKYENICGGCDGIKTADEIKRRLYHFAGQHRHVLLEGILVAHTFQRYHDIAVDLEEYGYSFCFLDTPLKTCVARVRKRRIQAGNTKELNPDNIKKDHARIWGRLRLQAQEAGLTCYELSHRDPMPQVYSLLESP